MQLKMVYLIIFHPIYNFAIIELILCMCFSKQGEPLLTSTSTLSIQIIDVNNHAPFLNVSTIEMWQSNETSQANIRALDLDEEPNVGPLRFKLLEDVGDKTSRGLS